jgi:hypothetical protein
VITTAEEDRRDRRFIVIALISSIVVHLLGALLYVGSSGFLAKVHLPFMKPPEKEVVTLSSAIRIDKRPKPVPVQRPKSQPPQPRSPQSPPNPQTLPELPAPARVIHELAKTVPTAQPNPSPPPSMEPSALPERQVAALQKPTQHVGRPRKASAPSLSQEELSRIENDLSRTIAQARSDTNPLAVSRQQPAASSRRYRMQMLGSNSDLKGYQGICDPTRPMWQQNGLDYYYVSCNVQKFDGNMERQAMPWPIHFPPNRDPFNGSMTAAEVQRSPVPGPDPDFKLPPGAYASPEMRDYAHRHGVDL